jgi:hypothetical protein
VTEHKDQRAMVSYTEQLNYLKKLCEPKMLVAAAVSLAWAVVGWFMRRAAPRLVQYISTPARIRQLRQGLLRTPYGRQVFETDGELGSAPWLCIPGMRIQYLGAVTWTQDFVDGEQKDGLHRWTWLLRGISDSADRLNRTLGLSIMRSWLSLCFDREDLRTDAYSNAERIANGAIFLRLTGDGTIPEDMRKAFEHMALMLTDCLEYFPGHRTGNHAFNNARGIFIAGAVAENRKMVEIANEIFRERLPVLVTKDGFLREASSHYHFLFTRWALEVWWFAVAYEEKETQNIIGVYLPKLVERCWFFLVRSEETGTFDFPLIGDISPDCPPDWLISLPWSSVATAHYKPPEMPNFNPKQQGWASLFGFSEGHSRVYDHTTAVFPDSGWYRLSHGSLLVYCFAESMNGTLRADHKHNDLCSFVCFYGGERSIIDCGRLDYTPSIHGRYGKSVYAHNSITLDGISPCVEPQSWIASAYSAVRVTTSLSECDSGICFLLTHDGFRRVMGKRITHSRKLILRHRALDIEDHIGGVESLDVRLRFHLAEPSIIGRGPRISFDSRLRRAQQSHGEVEGVANHCVREYGVPELCTTYDLCGQFSAPTSILNSFDWN